MASLALTSPPSVKIPSYLSSSSSSLFSRSSISFRTTESRSRICVSGYAKCNLPKALNGNARVPIINETTIPKFFDSSRLEKSVSRNNTKLKLFSGTANPAQSPRIWESLRSRHEENWNHRSLHLCRGFCHGDLRRLYQHLRVILFAGI